MRGDEHTLVSEETGRRWPIVNGRPVFTGEGRDVIVQSEAHLSNELPEGAVRLIEQADGLVLNSSAAIPG
jgi:hypothetical protein